MITLLKKHAEGLYPFFKRKISATISSPTAIDGFCETLADRKKKGLIPSLMFVCPGITLVLQPENSWHSGDLRCLK
jgi:hypothetical protein